MNMMTPPLREIAASIPPSPSDELLHTWGYDLAAEYVHVVGEAGIKPGSRVLELATGTGRMTAVLTRFGYRVLGGDASDEKSEQVWRRVQPQYSQSVELMSLDMRALPFKSSSVSFITCMNTLHELEDPGLCLREMIRVHDRSGIFIVGDFNETGFDAMQRLHQQIYRDKHPRGFMDIAQAGEELRSQYRNVKTIHTSLNITFIASGNR